MKSILIAIFSCIALQIFAQADKTLTIKEYQQGGFPNLSKSWTNADLEKALDALVTVKGRNADALPKLRSAKSGMVFKKLLAEFSVLKYVSEKERTEKSSRLTELCQPLLNIYNTPETNASYYSIEIVELDNTLLTNAHYQLLYYDEFTKKHPQLTEKQNMQVKALKHAYHSLVVSILTDLTKTGVYKTADLERLSRVFKNSLQQDGKYLTLSAQTSIRVMLMRIANNKISAIEKKNIEEAQVIVNRLH